MGKRQNFLLQKIFVKNFLPVIINLHFLFNNDRLHTHDFILFSFLHDLDSLSTGTLEQIEEAAAKLVNTYKNDLDPCHGFELTQFKASSKLIKNVSIDYFSPDNFLYESIMDKVFRTRLSA